MIAFYILDESPASKSLIGSLLADPAPGKQVSNTISKQTIAQNDTTTTMRYRIS